MGIDWQKINNFGRDPKPNGAKGAAKGAKPGKAGLKREKKQLPNPLLAFGKKKKDPDDHGPTMLAPASRGSMSRMVAKEAVPSGPRFGDDEPDDDATDDFLTRGSGPTKQEMITKGVMIGAIVALVCGPLALLLSLGGGGNSKAAAPPPPAAEQVNTGAEARASDMARQFLIAYLQAASGDSEKLAPYITLDFAASLPLKPLYKATDPQVVSIRHDKASGENAQDTYTVTVAAMVQTMGTDSAARRRHFQVTAVVIDEAASAVALPKEVAAPVYQLDAKTNYPFSVSAGPLRDQVQGFLSAQLAGNGEVVPYLADKVRVLPLRPAPYKAVEVVEVKASRELPPSGEGNPNDTVDVLATVNQRTADAPGLLGQYPLSFKWSDGKWVVTGVDQAPRVLKPEQPPAATQAPTAAAGASASTGSASASGTSGAGKSASSGNSGSTSSGTSGSPSTSAAPPSPAAPPSATNKPAAPSPVAPRPSVNLPTVPAGPLFR